MTVARSSVIPDPSHRRPGETGDGLSQASLWRDGDVDRLLWTSPLAEQVVRGTARRIREGNWRGRKGDGTPAKLKHIRDERRFKCAAVLLSDDMSRDRVFPRFLGLDSGSRTYLVEWVDAPTLAEAFSTPRPANAAKMADGVVSGLLVSREIVGRAVAQDPGICIPPELSARQRAEMLAGTAWLEIRTLRAARGGPLDEQESANVHQQAMDAAAPIEHCQLSWGLADTHPENVLLTDPNCTFLDVEDIDLNEDVGRLVGWLGASTYTSSEIASILRTFSEHVPGLGGDSAVALGELHLLVDRLQMRALLCVLAGSPPLHLENRPSPAEYRQAAAEIEQRLACEGFSCEAVRALKGSLDTVLCRQTG